MRDLAENLGNSLRKINVPIENILRNFFWEPPLDRQAGTHYMSSMRVIAKRTLRGFWERHPDAKGPLEAWHDAIRRNEWRDWTELKAHFQRAVDPLGDDRYVFNIKGNKYRLIVKIDFRSKLALVKFIGAHAEYDRINAKEVEL